MKKSSVFWSLFRGKSVFNFRYPFKFPHYSKCPFPLIMDFQKFPLDFIRHSILVGRGQSGRRRYTRPGEEGFSAKLKLPARCYCCTVLYVELVSSPLPFHSIILDFFLLYGEEKNMSAFLFNLILMLFNKYFGKGGSPTHAVGIVSFSFSFFLFLTTSF